MIENLNKKIILSVLIFLVVLQAGFVASNLNYSSIPPLIYHHWTSGSTACEFCENDFYDVYDCYSKIKEESFNNFCSKEASSGYYIHSVLFDDKNNFQIAHCEEEKKDFQLDIPICSSEEIVSGDENCICFGGLREYSSNINNNCEGFPDRGPLNSFITLTGTTYGICPPNSACYLQGGENNDDINCCTALSEELKDVTFVCTADGGYGYACCNERNRVTGGKMLCIPDEETKHSVCSECPPGQEAVLKTVRNWWTGGLKTEEKWVCVPKCEEGKIRCTDESGCDVNNCCNSNTQKCCNLDCCSSLTEYCGVLEDSECCGILERDFKAGEGKDMELVPAEVITKKNDDKDCCPKENPFVFTDKGYTIITDIERGVVINKKLWNTCCGFVGKEGDFVESVCKEECYNPFTEKCCRDEISEKKGNKNIEKSYPSHVCKANTFCCGREDCCSEGEICCYQIFPSSLINKIRLKGYFTDICTFDPLNLENWRRTGKEIGEFAISVISSVATGGVPIAASQDILSFAACLVTWNEITAEEIANDIRANGDFSKKLKEDLIDAVKSSAEEEGISTDDYIQKYLFS